jgi:hypothetical protein
MKSLKEKRIKKKRKECEKISTREDIWYIWQVQYTNLSTNYFQYTLETV